MYLSLPGLNSTKVSHKKLDFLKINGIVWKESFLQSDRSAVTTQGEGSGRLTRLERHLGNRFYYRSGDPPRIFIIGADVASRGGTHTRGSKHPDYLWMRGTGRDYHQHADLGSKDPDSLALSRTNGRSHHCPHRATRCEDQGVA